VTVDLSSYDFLDFGSSEGASLAYGVERLGGKRGLGIDRDPRKVASAREQGFDVFEGDLTALDFPDGSVRFVVMSHVLEHLADRSALLGTLASARRLATDFLFVRGPWFDSDEELARLGLKLYWSDWTGHPSHVTAPLLAELLHELDLHDFVIQGRSRIRHSDHDTIHPLASPPNQHEWRADTHPPKPSLDLPQPVFREIFAYVRLRPIPVLRWRKILRSAPGGETLIRSAGC